MEKWKNNKCLKCVDCSSKYLQQCTKLLGHYSADSFKLSSSVIYILKKDFKPVAKSDVILDRIVPNLPTPCARRLLLFIS